MGRTLILDRSAHGFKNVHYIWRVSGDDLAKVDITVERLRVHTVELAHPFGEIGLWYLDKKVVVIRHQAVGVTDPTVVFDDLAQNSQESNPIDIIKKDVLPYIHASHHVV